MSHVSELKNILIPEALLLDKNSSENWTLNNIRTLVIFDEAVFVRYYVKTKYNDKLFMKYVIDPISENSTDWMRNEQVISLLLNTKYKGVHINNLEEILIFSKNRKYLDYEELENRDLYNLRKDKFPRLRKVSFYHIRSGFDVDKAFTDIEEFFENNSNLLPLDELFKEYKKKESHYISSCVSSTEYFWHDHIIHMMYSLSKNKVDEEVQAAMEKIRQDALKPEAVEVRINKMLSADADRFEYGLKMRNDKVGKWLNSLAKIVKYRVGMEQALTYGYFKLTADERIINDPERRFIVNYYYNGTICRQIYKEKHLSRRFGHYINNINYAYLAELAKRTNNKNLYNFFSQFPNIVSYVANDYEWKEYLTPDISFNYAETKDLTLDEYSNMVSKAMGNRTDVMEAYNKNTAKHTDIIYKLWENDYAEESSDNQSKLLDVYCDTSAVLASMDELMQIILQMELLSCAKVYLEVSALWAKYESDFSENMKIIHKQIIDKIGNSVSEMEFPLNSLEDKVLREYVVDNPEAPLAVKEWYYIALDHKEKRDESDNNHVFWDDMEEIDSFYDDPDEVSGLICETYEALFMGIKIFDENMDDAIEYEYEEMPEREYLDPDEYDYDYDYVYDEYECAICEDD